MQFADMQRVGDFVSPPMVAETKQWLLSRRNSKGGFDLSQQALDSFGRAPAEIAHAYIIWALVSSGEKEQDLKEQIDEL